MEYFPSLILLYFLLLQFTTCKIDINCSRVIGFFDNFRCVSEHNIGQGAFGAAFLITNGDSEFVLKVAKIDDQETLARAANEKNLLLLCKHPNVIRLIEWFRDNSYQYAVLEFAEGGSLTDFIYSALFRKVSLSFKLRIFLKILKGVDHIHSHGYVHGDIKPDNIVFATGYEPKIIDFDLATPRFGWGLMKGNSAFTEPRIIFAPEQKIAYDETIDIYALGVLLYYLVQDGKSPFLDDSKHELNQTLSVGSYQVSGNLPVSVVQMIERCLFLNKSARWNMQMLILKTEEYLKGDDNSVITGNVSLSNRSKSEIK